MSGTLVSKRKDNNALLKVAFKFGLQPLTCIANCKYQHTYQEENVCFNPNAYEDCAVIMYNYIVLQCPLFEPRERK